MQLFLPNPLLSQVWRCSWSSAGRRCSNYIWVINSFIAYWGETYIRGFTVDLSGYQKNFSNIWSNMQTSYFTKFISDIFYWGPSASTQQGPITRINPIRAALSHAYRWYGTLRGQAIVWTNDDFILLIELLKLSEILFLKIWKFFFKKFFFRNVICHTVAILLSPASVLTHWGRVMHICVGNLTLVGSDYGLSPGRRQAIFWTNDGILLIGPLATNCSEILIEIHTFSFKKMQLKMSSTKWRPFCLDHNVLTALTPRRVST